MSGPIHVGDTPLDASERPVRGGFVELAGELCYRIENVGRMAPFFMTVVSGSDHWMFVSSRGGLTAGRRDADGALFTYTTDDRIHDASGARGPFTVLMVTRGGRTWRWEPFSEPDDVYRVTRSLYKNVPGTRLVFEEVNESLGLTFRYAWTSGEQFGFQRQVTLTEDRGEPANVSVLDGLLDLLPASVDRGMQASYSTLVDAYKRTELDPESKLALYRLSSIPVDRAEPSEALQVNTVWCAGLPDAKRLLSEAQVPAFRRGGSVEEEHDVRGVRGAYLVQDDFALEPRAAKEWTFVCEVEQDSGAVGALDRALRAGSIGVDALERDATENTEKLVTLVARADGLQRTGSTLEDARHFANTLFNIMRGGVFETGGRLPGADVRAYVGEVAPLVAQRHRTFLDELPESLTRMELATRAERTGDADLVRIAGEYLPLLFSRRHGDPSRPWNAFSIMTRGGGGRSPYEYQGNWRDIFQNWEALCASFPRFLEGAVARFVNASTADGYNPYRVTRAGFEWEVPDPGDPWAFIGYWGDHQLIYLVRLLEAWRRHASDELLAALSRGGFVYADVPYRILGYPKICRDPRNTIVYDEAYADTIAERVRREGHEGKLVRDASGALHRVTLAEKLLVPVLVKLTNFVPELGLWLTTQRPEWNDANNALVGSGASVVTLAHLSTALRLYADLFDEAGGELAISVEVAKLWRAVRAVLLEAPPADGVGPRARRERLDALGAAGEAHRGALYDRGFSGARERLAATELSASLREMRAWVDHSLRCNRRDDGLYHAYNLLEFDDDGVRARRLPAMLEGQVAVLASGLLSEDECRAVLAALRESDLYRDDQASYLLYPDRALPRFTEKNRLPADALSRSRLLSALVDAGDQSIVVPGDDGALHFAAPLRNAAALAEALHRLAHGPHGDLARAEHALLLELYEEVFDHSAFTGRSGAFYGYEGLGCIYWHQVSKLLLAVRDLCDERGGADDGALEACYDDLRRGLGTHRPPETYGAFPTDPYSHTPSFAGAQQPGMTGQVKEDFLARMAELGVRVRGGRLHLGPTLASALHFVEAPTRFAYRDGTDAERDLLLEPGTLALTCFQVPVVLHRGGEPRVVVTDADGAQRETAGFALEPEESARLFERRSSAARIDVYGR